MATHCFLDDHSASLEINVFMIPLVNSEANVVRHFSRLYVKGPTGVKNITRFRHYGSGDIRHMCLLYEL